MSIQYELNKIKSAVYGSDVRDAIHDSIKKAYDDASVNGNANMEVKMARGIEPTLNDRLDKMDDKDTEVTAQLAQKASQNDVQNLRDNKRDKTVEITMLDLGQDVKTALTGGSVAVVGVGAISDVNIKDGKISEIKTSFLTPSVNIFNKTADKILNGYYHFGIWAENAIYFTILLPVKPNKVYANNIRQKYEVNFFTASMEFISSVAADGWTNLEVPNNQEIYYASLVFRTSTSIDEIMVVEGTTLPTEYIPYNFTLSEKILLSEKQITSVFEKGIATKNTSKNRFNKNNVVSGLVYEDGSYFQSESGLIADKVTVEGLLRVTISGLPTYTDGYRNRYVAFYDQSGVFISYDIISRTLTEKTIKVPYNAHYMSFTIKGSTTEANLDIVQVENGLIATEYEPYKESILSVNNIEANAPLKTSGKTALIFGDSITETAEISEDGSTYTENTTTNWVTMANSYLDLGGFKNYARSGASYKDQSVSGDRRKSISEQINMAISKGEKADIVVVSAGTNDGSSSIGDYDTAMSKTSLGDLDRNNLYEAIRWAFWTIRSHYPNATCFAATPLQRASQETPTALMEAIVKMAKRYNFILIDANAESGIVRDFEVSSGAGRYLADGLHPNNAGKDLMAKLYSRVILNSLNY